MNTDFQSDLFTFREANLADLEALVKLHVASWNATYPHYFPKPTPELRKKQWEKAYLDKEGNWFCYVVENSNGEIIGFATGNDFEHEDLPFKGQLNKIHFYQSYHRLGLGRKLVSHVVQRFLNEGIHSMILFADPENPNIRFYDALQGIRLPDKQGIFQGAFGWYDLQKLAELCNR